MLKMIMIMMKIKTKTDATDDYCKQNCTQLTIQLNYST